MAQFVTGKSVRATSHRVKDRGDHADIPTPDWQTDPSVGGPSDTDKW